MKEVEKGKVSTFDVVFFTGLLCIIISIVAATVSYKLQERDVIDRLNYNTKQINTNFDKITKDINYWNWIEEIQKEERRKKLEEEIKWRKEIETKIKENEKINVSITDSFPKFAERILLETENKISKIIKIEKEE